MDVSQMRDSDSDLTSLPASSEIVQCRPVLVQPPYSYRTITVQTNIAGQAAGDEASLR